MDVFSNVARQVAKKIASGNASFRYKNLFSKNSQELDRCPINYCNVACKCVLFGISLTFLICILIFRRLALGHVDELGIFIPEMEPEPEDEAENSSGKK